MISANTVSQIFAGIGVVFGLASVGLLVAKEPVYAIPTSILAVGSIMASAIHAKV